MKDVAHSLRMRGLRVAVICSTDTCGEYESVGGLEIVATGPRDNMLEVARRLFPALRDLDSLGVDVAVAEGYEDSGLGLAVMNRLRKSSSRRITV